MLRILRLRVPSGQGCLADESTDDRFHTVFDAEGNWRIGVQLAPDHTPPQWPDDTPQQIHLDLHVADPDQVQAREEHW